MSSDLADAPPFPARRTCPYHPPESYTEISGRGPVNRVTLWDGRVVWLITGYQQARTLLTDSRLSADRTSGRYPTMAPHLQAQAARKLVLVGEDPPLHDKHRRLLNPEFSLKRARATSCSSAPPPGSCRPATSSSPSRPVPSWRVTWHGSSRIRFANPATA